MRIWMSTPTREPARRCPCPCSVRSHTTNGWSTAGLPEQRAGRSPSAPILADPLVVRATAANGPGAALGPCTQATGLRALTGLSTLGSLSSSVWLLATAIVPRKPSCCGNLFLRKTTPASSAPQARSLAVPWRYRETLLLKRHSPTLPYLLPSQDANCTRPSVAAMRVLMILAASHP